MEDHEQRNFVAEALLKRRTKTMLRYDDTNYIDTSCVTHAEYQLFLNEKRIQGKYYQPDHWTEHKYSPGKGLEPIKGIRASDATTFCKWLTEKEGGYWRYEIPKSSNELTAIVKQHKLENFWVGEVGIYYLLQEANANIEAVADSVAAIHTNNKNTNFFNSYLSTYNNLSQIHSAETFCIDRTTDLELQLDLSKDLDLAQDFNIDLGLDLGLGYALEFALDRNHNNVLSYAKDLNLISEDESYSTVLADLKRIRELVSEFQLVVNVDFSVDLATRIKEFIDQQLGKSVDVINSYKTARVILIMEAQKIVTQTIVSYLEVLFMKSSTIDLKRPRVKHVVEIRLQILLHLFIRLSKILNKITERDPAREMLLLTRHLLT